MQKIKNKISNFKTKWEWWSEGTINECGFVLTHAGGEGKKKKGYWGRVWGFGILRRPVSIGDEGDKRVMMAMTHEKLTFIEQLLSSCCAPSLFLTYQEQYSLLLLRRLVRTYKYPLKGT